MKLLHFTTLLLFFTASLHADPPNIVFILADDMGFDAVSVHNEMMGPLQTPLPDTLMTRGTDFTKLQTRKHS